MDKRQFSKTCGRWGVGRERNEGGMKERGAKLACSDVTSVRITRAHESWSPPYPPLLSSPSCSLSPSHSFLNFVHIISHNFFLNRRVRSYQRVVRKRKRRNLLRNAHTDISVLSLPSFLSSQLGGGGFLQLLVRCRARNEPGYHSQSTACTVGERSNPAARGDSSQHGWSGVVAVIPSPSGGHLVSC